jgi:ketosteroid isomerase-like protein
MPRTRVLTVLALLLGVLGVALPAAGQGAAPEGPDAGLDANRALVRRYFALLSEGDLAKLDEVLAPDFLDRTPGNPHPTRGPGVIRETQIKARELFTDISYLVDDLLAEGDHVAARYTVRARHRTTTRFIQVTGASFFRISGGRIKEGWIINDQIELFRQLGYTLMPPQGNPPAPSPTPTPAPSPTPPPG